MKKKMLIQFMLSIKPVVDKFYYCFCFHKSAVQVISSRLSSNCKSMCKELMQRISITFLTSKVFWSELDVSKGNKKKSNDYSFRSYIFVLQYLFQFSTICICIVHILFISYNTKIIILKSKTMLLCCCYFKMLLRHDTFL